MTTNNINVVDFGFGSSKADAELDEIVSRYQPKTEDDWENIAEVFKPSNASQTDYKSAFIKSGKKAGHSRAALKRIWNRARPDREAYEDIFERRQAATIVEAERRNRYTLLDDAGLTEELQLRQQKRWIVHGIIPREGVFAIYGPSGSGKSFVAIDAGCAIADGANWFGYKTTAAYVLYVGLEGAAGIPGRFEAWKRYQQRGQLPINLRVLLPTSFRLTEPNDVRDLAVVAPRGCIVIIDTLNRAAPDADENSSRDMGRMIEGAKLLQQLTGGVVVLIAHPGKDSTKGVRGHSSLFAALDGAILVERAADFRSWKVDKAKDGVDGIEHSFRLATVPIGQDEDGEITSCVVVRDESLPTRTERLSKGAYFAKQTFEAAMQEYGPQVHFSNWQKVYYRMSSAGSDAAKQRAFHRAREELVDAGKLGVADNVYWLCEPGPALAEQAKQVTRRQQT